MGKTFKKVARIEDQDVTGSHYFKYKKSKQTVESFKNIDKYIRSQDVDNYDEGYDYSYDKEYQYK